jgi:hypothetical protein
MPTNEKRRLTRFLVKYVFHILALISGMFFGWVICRWSYFEIDKKISVHETLSIIVTAWIAIYLGGIIQEAGTRKQNDHALLIDEIKRLIAYIERIEVWLDARALPFESAKSYFRKGSINIKGCKDIFTAHNVCKPDDFNNALDMFNSIKQDVLAIPPVGNIINLTPAQADEFEQRYAKVRMDLMELLLRY